MDFKSLCVIDFFINIVNRSFCIINVKRNDWELLLSALAIDCDCHRKCFTFVSAAVRAFIDVATKASTPNEANNNNNNNEHKMYRSNGHPIPMYASCSRLIQ